MELADWADVVLQVEASLQDVWPFLLKRKPWFPTLHVGYKLSGLSWKYELMRALQRFSLRFGYPIGVSRYVLNTWSNRGISILNPVDLSIFGPPPEGSFRDVDVLYVGREIEYKGIFVLMDALPKLVEENLVRRAVFVGEGPDHDRLAARVRDAGLSEVITLAGPASSSGVAAWMQRSRVLAFPTTPAWLEAAGLTVLEALACGCEVVASDIGGVAETGGGFVRLVKSGDAASLLDGLRKALKGESARTAGLSEYLKKQSLSEVASRYIEVMRSRLKR